MPAPGVRAPRLTSDSRPERVPVEEWEPAEEGRRDAPPSPAPAICSHAATAGARSVSREQEREREARSSPAPG